MTLQEIIDYMVVNKKNGVTFRTGKLPNTTITLYNPNRLIVV